MTLFESKTDEQLVELALKNDLEAFEELINRYQDPMLRYCSRLLNFNQTNAEDAVSETFLKVWKNLASFKSNLKFSSWIYRIAHNTAVNQIRSNSKYFLVDIQDFWHIPANTKEETKVGKDDLEKVLYKLSDSDKNLLILFYLEEKSLREIGEILKFSENTVAVKLKRARERAKKIINQEFTPTF